MNSSPSGPWSAICYARDPYLRLSGSPIDLEAILASHGPSSVIVIDEVQKVPRLLDEVQRLIETRRLRFLLTGSSARKPRRGQANLLAGRAWQANLFPLTWDELTDTPFDLDRYLRYGGLPSLSLSQDPVEELQVYVHTSLLEEMQRVSSGGFPNLLVSFKLRRSATARYSTFPVLVTTPRARPQRSANTTAR